MILLLVIFGAYNHHRAGKLQKQIKQLEKQIKKQNKQQEDLEDQLEQKEKELKEKEAQLEKAEEATYDDPDKPNVYLTFDDGPSTNTDSILDTLGKYNVRATFFCIARDGEENAARYKRIVQEGHVLGMHSYTHVYKTVYADMASFQKDVTDLSDFLYGITGERPKYYRFPGGSSNTVSKVSMKKCIRFVTKEGLTYFDWNAQNDDATGVSYTASQLVSHAMTSVRNAGQNVVLLMHDEQTKTATAESLPKLIRQLKTAGYDILPITDETPLVQHISYDSVS
jgi:peptidoglycan/xylan/chitin deacetylase (PgdA/CDA1 family)